MSEPAAGNPILDLFNVLVPPARVEVEDIYGNRYVLPGALPAKRQIPVLQALEQLKDVSADNPGAQAIAGLIIRAKDGNLNPETAAADVASAVFKLAGDDAVMQTLSDALRLAHPGAVGKALAAGKHAAAELRRAGDETAVDPEHAHDVFAVEEIVSGLLPFFFRLARRVAQAMSEAITRPAAKA